MPYSSDSMTLYGDTTGVLADREMAASQALSPSAGGSLIVNIVGDASELQAFSLGGDDTISIPLAFDNTAIGDAWTITDHAHGGNDYIVVHGGMFSYTQAVGDAETMTGHAFGGNDYVEVSGPGIAAGDALLLTGHAHGGNDQLTGWGPGRGSGPNLYGDAETMTGQAVGGDDTITGKDYFQAIMYGDANVLSGHARGGNDLLVGGANLGNNPYEPYNAMYGDGAQLLDYAQGGNDTLVSGASSDDIMWGDAPTVGPHATTGADLFVFAPRNGHDQIMDFEPGKDRIELKGFDFTSFKDLATLFQTTPGGVLISFDASDDVLLRGVSVGQLTAHDFIFA